MYDLPAIYKEFLGWRRALLLDIPPSIPTGNGKSTMKAKRLKNKNNRKRRGF